MLKVVCARAHCSAFRIGVLFLAKRLEERIVNENVIKFLDRVLEAQGCLCESPLFCLPDRRAAWKSESLRKTYSRAKIEICVSIFFPSLSLSGGDRKFGNDFARSTATLFLPVHCSRVHQYPLLSAAHVSCARGASRFGILLCVGTPLLPTLALLRSVTVCDIV